MDALRPPSPVHSVHSETSDSSAFEFLEVDAEHEPTDTWSSPSSEFGGDGESEGEQIDGQQMFSWPGVNQRSDEVEYVVDQRQPLTPGTDIDAAVAAVMPPLSDLVSGILADPSATTIPFIYDPTTPTDPEADHDNQDATRPMSPEEDDTLSIEHDDLASDIEVDLSASTSSLSNINPFHTLSPESINVKWTPPQPRRTSTVIGSPLADRTPMSMSSEDKAGELMFKLAFPDPLIGSASSHSGSLSPRSSHGHSISAIPEHAKLEVTSDDQPLDGSVISIVDSPPRLLSESTSTVHSPYVSSFSGGDVSFDTGDHHDDTKSYTTYNRTEAHPNEGEDVEGVRAALKPIPKDVGMRISLSGYETRPLVKWIVVQAIVESLAMCIDSEDGEKGVQDTWDVEGSGKIYVIGGRKVLVTNDFKEVSAIPETSNCPHLAVLFFSSFHDTPSIPAFPAGTLYIPITADDTSSTGNPIPSSSLSSFVPPPSFSYSPDRFGRSGYTTLYPVRGQIEGLELDKDMMVLVDGRVGSYARLASEWRDEEMKGFVEAFKDHDVTVLGGALDESGVFVATKEGSKDFGYKEESNVADSVIQLVKESVWNLSKPAKAVILLMSATWFVSAFYMFRPEAFDTIKSTYLTPSLATSRQKAYEFHQALFEGKLERTLKEWKTTVDPFLTFFDYPSSHMGMGVHTKTEVPDRTVPLTSAVTITSAEDRNIPGSGKHKSTALPVPAAAPAPVEGKKQDPLMLAAPAPKKLIDAKPSKYVDIPQAEQEPECGCAHGGACSSLAASSSSSSGSGSGATSTSLSLRMEASISEYKTSTSSSSFSTDSTSQSESDPESSSDSFDEMIDRLADTVKSSRSRLRSKLLKELEFRQNLMRGNARKINKRINKWVEGGLSVWKGDQWGVDVWKGVESALNGAGGGRSYKGGCGRGGCYGNGNGHAATHAARAGRHANAHAHPRTHKGNMVRGVRVGV